jgi:hypothetical protein
MVTAAAFTARILFAAQLRALSFLYSVQTNSAAFPVSYPITVSGYFF